MIDRITSSTKNIGNSNCCFFIDSKNFTTLCCWLLMVNFVELSLLHKKYLLEQNMETRIESLRGCILGLLLK